MLGADEGSISASIADPILKPALAAMTAGGILSIPKQISGLSMTAKQGFHHGYSQPQGGGQVSQNSLSPVQYPPRKPIYPQ